MLILKPGTKYLNLFKVEFIKLFYSNSFWIIIGLYGVLQAGLLPILVSKANLIFEIQTNEAIDALPNLMLYAHFWLAGALKILPAMIIIISQCNEFEFKTIRQTIMDGWSRGEFVLSKATATISISLLAVAITCLVSILAYKYNDQVSSMESLRWPLSVGLFIEISTYLLITLLITTIVKNPALVLVTLALLTTGEYLLLADLENSWEGISEYFPLYALNHPFESNMNMNGLHFNSNTLQTSLMWAILTLIINVFYLRSADL